MNPNGVKSSGWTDTGIEGSIFPDMGQPQNSMEMLQQTQRYRIGFTILVQSGLITAEQAKAALTLAMGAKL